MYSHSSEPARNYWQGNFESYKSVNRCRGKLPCLRYCSSSVNHQPFSALFRIRILGILFISKAKENSGYNVTPIIYCHTVVHDLWHNNELLFSVIVTLYVFWGNMHSTWLTYYMLGCFPWTQTANSFCCRVKYLCHNVFPSYEVAFYGWAVHRTWQLCVIFINYVVTWMTTR